MGPEYYLEMANLHGYGDTKKEALWLQCPPAERYEILCHLMTFRAVKEVCRFEEDFSGSAEENATVLDGKLREWSLLEFGNMPMTLEPFIFFSCWGEGFSLEFLKQNASRFLWLPEPLPGTPSRSSFLDDDD